MRHACRAPGRRSARSPRRCSRASCPASCRWSRRSSSATTPGPRYETEETALAAGDLLLLYTDGMSELRRDGQMLEVEGLRDWLADCSAEAPGDVVKALYARALDWSAGDLHDDIALVAIRCR